MINNFGDAKDSVNPFYLTEAYLPNKKTPAATHKKIGGRPVILVIPELLGATPSPCSYIRLLMPLSSSIIHEHFIIRFSSLQFATSVDADIVIVNRVPCTDIAELNCFLRHVQAIGAKLIYDIDDQLLELSQNHPEIEIYRERQAIVLQMLTAADLVFTSTHFLAAALTPVSKKIAVLENEIDFGFLAPSPPPLPQISNQRKKFNILYMGTTTHEMDLIIVLSALQKLHEQNIDFTLFLIGITTSAQPYDWIQTIAPPTSANNYPEFMRWLRSLNIFDLGIAPLESTRFNQCKSAMKFWDYTSINLATLASDVEAYNEIIVDGKTGYLAKNNTESWLEKFQEALENRAQLGHIAENAAASLRELAKRINGKVARKDQMLALLNAST